MNSNVRPRGTVSCSSHAVSVETAALCARRQPCHRLCGPLVRWRAAQRSSTCSRRSPLFSKLIRPSAASAYHGQRSSNETKRSGAGHSVFFEKKTKVSWHSRARRRSLYRFEHEVQIHEQSAPLPPAAKHCYRRGLRTKDSVQLLSTVAGHSFKARGLTPHSTGLPSAAGEFER